jgi:hypothetical protein
MASCSKICYCNPGCSGQHISTANLTQEYLTTGTYLAVNFLLKAVTVAHRHLDVHGIDGILRQVIKMFEEAKIPDSAKYVRGVSETISDIAHTALSPRDQPPEVEQSELFDINTLMENPVSQWPTHTFRGLVNFELIFFTVVA